MVVPTAVAAPVATALSSVRRAAFWLGFWGEVCLARLNLFAALRRRRGVAAQLRWNRYERDRRRRLGDGLTRYEARVHSQNGEDGILEELFRRIGHGGRVFVEFGAGDGSENCSRNLVERHGWSGFWFEGDPATAERARAAVAGRSVVVQQRFLDRTGILEVFRAAGVPREIDLLVIDVDGNDYWLWEELASRYRSRVVVIEYNGAFPPGISWVMRYDARHSWDRSCFHGASLDALTRLAERLGYRLVACDRNGVNAFFVRADIDAGPTVDSADTSGYYFAPKVDLLGVGHPKVPIAESPMEALPADDARLVTLRVDGVPPNLEAGELVYARVEIENPTARPLGTGRPHPVNLSYHWFDSDGKPVVFDGLRTRLPTPVPPRARQHLLAGVMAPDEPGSHVLRISLVQEGVRWLDEAGMQGFEDLAMSVTPL